MRYLRSVVALCSCLALSALPGFAQDKVKLKNGSELSGRILAEDDSTLTMKTGRSELTLPKSIISEISREQRPEEAPAAPAPTPEEALPEKAEWFAVRDEAGRVVGTFHRLERGELRGGRPAVRLEERFTFRREDGGHVNLHAIEWGTSELTPLAFHYREWEDEKGFVYQAEIASAHAQVTLVDREGVKRNERFPFPSGTQLPLLARRRLIQEAHTTARRITLPIFDPLQRKILARDHWIGERREIAPGTQVRVYGVARHRDQLCEEWLDGEGKSVRLELNGPYLVAEPAKPQDLERWIEGGDSLPIQSAEVRGGRGLFRTFLPNPLWTVVEAQPETALLVVRREEGDLSVVFLELGAGEEELTSEGALLELERRVRDLPAFERQGNLRARSFGPLDGFELEFQYRVGEGIRGGRVGLVQRGAKRLGYVISGPRRELEKNQIELERLLTRIELL
jgi:hypothetical protein